MEISSEAAIDGPLASVSDYSARGAEERTGASAVIPAVNGGEYLKRCLDALEHIYLRTEDRGVQAGAGMLVQTPGKRGETVERLALDEPLRAALGAHARAAGAARDWGVLARRDSAILDHHL
jgi:hypothetical protein